MAEKNPAKRSNKTFKSKWLFLGIFLGVIPIFFAYLFNLIPYFKGKISLNEFNIKDSTNHLNPLRESLNRLILHQLSLLDLKKEDLRLILIRSENDGLTWNHYQMKITLPSHLTAQQLKNTLEKKIKSIYPFLLISSLSPDKKTLEVNIQKDRLTIYHLSIFNPSAKKSISLKLEPSTKVMIAIIIDDLGPNITLAREFLNLNYPITLSILPFYAHSKEISKEAHARGREVILHLPLEPLNNNEKCSQKGILLTSMDEDTLLNQLRENIFSIPYICGVNNHMGSKFTAEHQSMEVLLNELKRQGLFFLDSLTTNKSQGVLVAETIKIPFLTRDVFLDRDLQGKTIEEKILQLSELAKKRGYAIGIGHPYLDTFNALKKMLPILESQGIKLVPLSQIISQHFPNNPLKNSLITQTSNMQPSHQALRQ